MHSVVAHGSVSHWSARFRAGVSGIVLCRKLLTNSLLVWGDKIERQDTVFL